MMAGLIVEELMRRWRASPIRALAASDLRPESTLVAGTLKGVYRSTDGGTRWELISPEGSKEIHEVESIAIDPGDARHHLRGNVASAVED